MATFEYVGATIFEPVMDGRYFLFGGSGGVSSSSTTSISGTNFFGQPLTYFGSFTLNDDGNVVGGTITKIVAINRWEITDISIPYGNFFELAGVILGGGNDTFFGDETANWIAGENITDPNRAGRFGNDTLYGFGGNDLLHGGPGDDLLDGGDGYDLVMNYFQSSGRTGNVSSETVSWASLIPELEAASGIPLSSYFPKLSERSSVEAGVLYDSFGSRDVLVDIEEISGTQYDDIIVAAGLTPENEGAFAGQGVAYGQGGNDVLFAVEGTGFISGGPGNDLIIGSDGDDLANGDDGDDFMFGGLGSDTYWGGSGWDYLDGGEGFDWFNTFNQTEGVRTNLSSGFVDLGLITGATAYGEIALLLPQNILDVLGERATYEANSNYESAGSIDLLYNFEGVRGTPFNDLIIASGPTDLEFTDLGPGGVAYGQAGSDVVIAPTGTAFISGGQDADLLITSGVEGEQITANGDGGNDWLLGGLSDDILRGLAGDDYLNGGIGNDFLEGDDPLDPLVIGNDILVGGAGFDVLLGGLGEDIFAYYDADEAPLGDVLETIVDFEQRADIIDVSGIDARSDLAGNQDFEFVGSGSYTGGGGELRANAENGSTVIAGDIDGDTLDDFAIVIPFELEMTREDFIGVMPAVTAQIRALDGVLDEGDSGTTVAQFEVYLDRPLLSDVTFDWAVTFGGVTRVNELDIRGSSGEVVVQAGELTAIIEVQVSGEAKPELDELLEIELFPSPSVQELVVVGDANTASTVVLNDDGEYTWENVAQWLYQDELGRAGGIISERMLPGMSTDPVLRDVERYYTGRELAKGEDLGYTLAGTAIAPFYDAAKLGALSLDEFLGTDTFGRWFSLVTGGDGSTPSPPGGIDKILLGFIDGLRLKFDSFSAPSNDEEQQSETVDRPDQYVPIESEPGDSQLQILNYVPNGDQNNLVVNVAGANDPVSSGGGDDFIISSTSSSVSSGGGNDLIWANLAPSEVDAGDGNDVVFGSDFVDIIRLGAGNDVVLPGLGSDEIYLGAGADIVRGRLDEIGETTVFDFGLDDAIIVENSVFSDSNLTVSFGSAILDIDVDLDGISDATVTLEGDFEGINFQVEEVDGNSVITAYEVEIVNLITGTNRSERLVGTDGDDAIRSLGGRFDRMSGLEGADQFIFGAETQNGRWEIDVIRDYEVGIDSIVLEDGASVRNIKDLWNFVVVTFEGDRDKLIIRGDDVDAENITIIDDPFAIV